MATKNDSYAGRFSAAGRYVDLNDKESQVRYHVNTYLRRLSSAFKFKGLPDTIPERDIKMQLMCNGNVFITNAPANGKFPGGLYSFTGGWGGEPNPYYLPSQYIIANPALNFMKTCEIGKDGVLIKNDSMFMGVLPMLNRYATFLTELDISFRIASINSRIAYFIKTGDDKGYKSAVELLKQIEAGKTGVIAQTPLLDGVDVTPGATGTQAIKDIIEGIQYMKGSCMNDIGLSANYNMKREAINSGEAEMTSNSLMPFIDDMQDSWKKGFDAVNEMFGTNITFEYASSWQAREDIENLEIEQLEATVDATKEEPEEKEEKENDDK